MNHQTTETITIPSELILYTPNQAAEILGCSETWLLTQLRQRKLPGHKIGRKWRLTQQDIHHAITITAQPVHTIDRKGMTTTSWRKSTRKIR